MVNNLIINITGTIAGVCTTASFLPQVISIIKTKNTESLSMYMFIIHITGVTLWIIYGVLITNYIIIIFNCIALLLCLIIIYYIISNIKVIPELIENNDSLQSSSSTDDTINPITINGYQLSTINI